MFIGRFLKKRAVVDSKNNFFTPGFGKQLCRQPVGFICFYHFEVCESPLQ